MPHLTLEYTDNLTFDVQRVLSALHQRLAATETVPLAGLKSRALRRSEWRIADGNKEYAFVHLAILLRAGRSAEAKREVVERALAVLEEEFSQRFEDSYLALSVDMKELEEGLSITRHNIPTI